MANRCEITGSAGVNAPKKKLCRFAAQVKNKKKKKEEEKEEKKKEKKEENWLVYCG